MLPILPFWFKQRQCKAEEAGNDRELKVTGPNLGEAYIRISEEGSRWRAALSLSPGGEAACATEAELPNSREAWAAAFELYRNHVIV